MIRTVYLVLCLVCTNGQELTNNRPIIGILAEEVIETVHINIPSVDYTSYVAASYVKFVEGAGARAVPIFVNKSYEYYEDLLNSVNGVLLPGGTNSFISNSSLYSLATKHIYEIAMKINDANKVFPIFGICLGFEILFHHANNQSECRVPCSSMRQSTDMQFKSNYKNSRLLGNAPSSLIETMEKEAVTPNFHKYCVTEELLLQTGLDTEWEALSLSKDWNDLEFISIVEHKKYPFYGTQWHPEKILYEFVEGKNISHSSGAIRAAHYFADFFVDEARKNFNTFENSTQVEDMFFYNYNPDYVGKKGCVFAQIYGFGRNNSNNIKMNLSVSSYIIFSLVLIVFK